MKPGACCREFVLNFHVEKSVWHEHAKREVDAAGLPYFRPLRIWPLHEDAPDDHRVQVLFSCDRIGSDGRRTQYEDRPDVCRIFEPASDPLCVMHRLDLKGIPIVVAN